MHMATVTNEPRSGKPLDGARGFGGLSQIPQTPPTFEIAAAGRNEWGVAMGLATVKYILLWFNQVPDSTFTSPHHSVSTVD